MIRALFKRPAARRHARCCAARPASSDPPIRWRMRGDGPWFDNQFGVLTIDGRRIDFRLEKAVPDGDERRGQRWSPCWTSALA